MHVPGGATSLRRVKHGPSAHLHHLTTAGSRPNQTALVLGKDGFGELSHAQQLATIMNLLHSHTCGARCPLCTIGICLDDVAFLHHQVGCYFQFFFHFFPDFLEHFPLNPI